MHRGGCSVNQEGWPPSNSPFCKLENLVISNNEQTVVRLSKYEAERQALLLAVAFALGL